jgi:hypothetical protein
MVVWFLLAGNDPGELRKVFADFYSVRENPGGIALWKWKKTCWICAPENAKQEILAAFAGFGAVEFSSAPPPADLEFFHGDSKALAGPS